MLDNKDIIIGEISNAVSKLLGTSSMALMRTAGKSASYKIWPELPSGKTPEEAGVIMTAGVKGLGGFGNFSIASIDDGVAKIEFCNCLFAELRKESGKECGEQAICYFGFGLVEETYKRLTGTQVKVELVKRDDGSGICFETATPR
jgi:hypothetical protein